MPWTAQLRPWHWAWLGFFCHGAPREHVQAFRCTTGLQVGPPWAFPSTQKQQFITEPSRIKAVLVARPLGPSDARAHPQAPGGRTRGPRVRLGASQLCLQKAGGGARRAKGEQLLCRTHSGRVLLSVQLRVERSDAQAF